MRSFVDRQANIERTQEMIFDLVTRCIADIQNAVAASGLIMRDVNVGIEIYQTTEGSHFIELNYADNKSVMKRQSG